MNEADIRVAAVGRARMALSNRSRGVFEGQTFFVENDVIVTLP